MLSTPGVGSGLDVSTIVDQLIALERRPLVRLAEEKVGLQAQISAFGALTAAVSGFQSALGDLDTVDAFEKYTASSSDQAVVGVSAGSNAARGVFNLEVERLAENHRLASGTTYADTDSTTLGVAGDTMTIQVGTDSFDVEIGELTLAGARDAINEAADNTGVTASILKDDLGYRLTLSANDTGSNNFVQVSYSGADPFAMTTLNADRDGTPGFTADDLDAVVVLENQFTVTSTSNTVGDAIEGVTLNLESAGTATIDVQRDNGAVTTAVEGFISAYNGVVSTLSGTGEDVLRSERSSLNAIESQLRNVLNTESDTGGAFSLLFQIGVTTTQAGTLELDSSVLSSALEADFDSVVSLFTSPTAGVAARFDGVAESLVGAGGLLDARSESLGRRVGDLEDRELDLERRIASKEDRLLAQFTALDGLVSQLNTTSEFLGQQLSQLASLNSGGNQNG